MFAIVDIQERPSTTVWLSSSFKESITRQKEGTMSLNEAVEIANAVLLIEVGNNGASASASGVSHSEGLIKGTLA